MRINLILVTIAFLTLMSLFMPSCASRKRSASLDISSSTIESQLTQIGALLMDKGDVPSQKAFNDFKAMHEEQGSTLYYSEAPSSMGTKVTNVIPVDFAQLYQENSQSAVISNPQKAYAYFVVVQRPDGWRGSLIITNTSGSVTQTSATGTQNNTPIVNTSTQASPSQEDPFVFIGDNDGQTLVPGALSTADILLPGLIQDENFAIELNLHDRAQLVVRTTDTDGGEDLTDVIQIELGKMVDGYETPIGKVNLVQVPSI